MFALERRLEILRLLNIERKISVVQLAEKFFTSEATIRRDLEKLERQNLIKRTYGGALLLDGLSSEIPIEVRSREHIQEKSVIGKLAARFVDNSDIIIMDGSTTTLAMVDHLRGVENLTVITNGIRTATYLGESLHQNVYCCGGKLRESTLILGGYQTEEFISHYNAEKLFFSCRAVSKTGGIMDFSDDDARLKQKMIERSGMVFLLCDGSKIGKKAFCFVSFFDAINYFITDMKPADDFLEVLDKAKVTVLYPPEE
jgi:DeoR/GlpR family transcriptional regulator of sugar metabolism